jgi:N6-adenosine-specific RNA methylase IME4
MKIYSPHPLAQKFPLMKGEAFEELKESIRQRGQLEPGTLLDGKLLDGRNRQEACRELGVPFKVVEWSSRRGETPAGFVDAMNLKRRHLNKGQEAAIAAALLPHFQKEARERQREAAKVAQAKKKRDAQMKPSERGPVKPKAEKKKPQRAAADAAKAAGVKVSARSVERFAFVKEKSPEIAKKIFEGDLTLKQGEHQVRRREQLEQVKSYVPPKGQFNVVTADFSWKYNDALDGENMHRALPYPPMELDEILAFIRGPLAEVCAPVCVLGNWVTNPIMLDLKIWPVVQAEIEKLGFRPKSLCTWRKTGPDGSSPVTGQGRGVRNDSEQFVIFVRGAVIFNDMGAEHAHPIQRTVFDAPRGENSEKPDRAYELIAGIVPYTARLELFARKARPGWVTSGSELEKPEAEKSSEEVEREESQRNLDAAADSFEFLAKQSGGKHYVTHAGVRAAYPIETLQQGKEIDPNSTAAALLLRCADAGKGKVPKTLIEAVARAKKQRAKDDLKFLGKDADVHKPGDSGQAGTDANNSSASTRVEPFSPAPGAGTSPDTTPPASPKAKERKLFIRDLPELERIGKPADLKARADQVTAELASSTTAAAISAAGLFEAKPVPDQVAAAPAVTELNVEYESPELAQALNKPKPPAAAIFTGPVVEDFCDHGNGDPKVCTLCQAARQREREATAAFDPVPDAPPAGMAQALEAAAPQPTAESLKPVPTDDIPF